MKKIIPTPDSLKIELLKNIDMSVFIASLSLFVIAVVVVLAALKVV